MIDDDDDFAETLVGGRLQRLPDLAFLQFAVTGHHDDAPVAPEEPVRARHPVRLRDAHAERAGVGGDERRLDVGVAGQSAKPAQPMNQREVELLERDEERVERGRVVPFRREVDVAPRCRRRWGRAVPRSTAR